MITICYFSPTGNAQYLAETLGHSIGDETTNLHALEFTNPEQLKQCSQLVILFSIHAFHAPRTVMNFVKAIPEGLCKNVSIIAVGCNETGMNRAATHGIGKILKAKNYTIGIDEVIAMPLTLVYSFPEKLLTKTLVDADEKIKSLATKIKGEESSLTKAPISAKVLSFFGHIEDFAARIFGLELFATKACESCGNCVKRCPERNISFNKNRKPKFGFNCLMCLRCIYECPHKAIKPRFSRFIPLKQGYSIKEIVKKQG